MTTTPTGTPPVAPAGPSAPSSTPSSSKDRQRLRDIAMTAAVTAVFTLLASGMYTSIAAALNPPHADVRLTVYAAPEDVHVGDRPVANFKVENQGTRTAAECRISWTPGDGLRPAETKYFSLRVNQEFPVTLTPRTGYRTIGTAHGTLAVRCADHRVDSHAIDVKVGARRHSPTTKPGSADSLGSVSACTRLRASSRLGAQLTRQGEAVVDGRCDTAADLDKAVGLYPRPTQAERKSIGAASTGTVLPVRCSVVGQVRQNVRAQSSDLWLRVELEGHTGYIPEIWTQHGTVRPC